MGAERQSATRGALKTGGGCGASIAHAWSRCVDASTADFFFLFFLHKSCNLFNILLVIRSASVERFYVSRIRDLKLEKAVLVLESTVAILEQTVIPG